MSEAQRQGSARGSKGLDTGLTDHLHPKTATAAAVPTPTTPAATAAVTVTYPGT